MEAGDAQRSRPLTDGRYGVDWWRQGVVYQIYPAELRGP